MVKCRVNSLTGYFCFLCACSMLSMGLLLILLRTGPHNTGRGGAPTEDTGLGDDEHPAGPPKGLAGEEGRMTTCDARLR